MGFAWQGWEHSDILRGFEDCSENFRYIGFPEQMAAKQFPAGETIPFAEDGVAAPSILAVYP